MKGISMRYLRLTASLVAFAYTFALPAVARDFVQDQAGMFSGPTVAQLNARISSFNAQTGKDVVVVTTPSLGGATLQNAATSAFSQQNVNGVLIFIARDDRRDIIVPDRAGAQSNWFTPDVLRSIRTSMESQFRSENYDAGITGAVDGVLNVYRAHLGDVRASNGAAVPGQRSLSTGGFHISMFWWIIIAIVAFLLLRSILRAMSAPRSYGAPGAPPAGMPPSGPGYGPGYGGFGGGGSFWSGLLGGLGGAWLGNELFRGGGMGGGIAPTDAAQLPADSGAGWQSDAGQADLGGASAGDWSGGGFGGDAGGDFGGGGGDSGGGW
ncbi:MAG: TPM domain-containing protein [Candidatus Eremiobacteraeota bacterium]|nr:TPM domain-containing protein [Candidatus Eremiobacteraeota bacterium]